ncbi:MAG TPA: nuclear transport factor 2 family protein [Thermoleophilaceae bacterium]
MRPAALVQTAAERFLEGADAPLLACFHADVELYWEPAISREPLVSSRAALEAWLRRIRADHPRLNATVTEPEEHGNGAVCEVIVTQHVVPDEVWRVALAVCVKDDLIREVRAFWSNESAKAWVLGFE